MANETNPAHEIMNAAFDAADRAYHVAVREATKGFATEACSRCGGKGEDFFCGPERAPGVCFKCGGSGRRIASRRDRNIATRLTKGLELVRLRACYVATREALKVAQAETPSTWATRSVVKELERKLAAYEKAGKELAAQVTS